MAKFNGTLWKIYVKDSGSDVEIGEVRSNSFNIEGETIDVSTKSSGGWKEYLPGWRSASCDVEGIIDFQKAGAKNAADLYNYLYNRTTLTLVQTTNVTGDQEFELTGYLVSLNITAEAESECSFTGTIQGTGIPTKTVVS